MSKEEPSTLLQRVLEGLRLSTCYLLFGVWCVMYGVKRIVLPVNYVKWLSKYYPYHQSELANERWRQLSLWQKYDLVWHNTWMFIPDAPGNPYKLVYPIELVLTNHVPKYDQPNTTLGYAVTH